MSDKSNPSAPPPRPAIDTGLMPDMRDPTGAVGRVADVPLPESLPPPLQSTVSAGYAGYGQFRIGDGRHITDYVRVLYRRRWVMATTFTVVVGTALLHTFTVTPLYDAKVQILIENETPNVVKFEEVFRQNKDTDDYYQTQYRILQSRLLARRTIAAEKLWDHPQFNGTSASSGRGLNPLEWAAAGADFVRRAIGPGTPPLPDEPGIDAAETAAQSPVIDAFLGGVTVTPVRNSRLVDVRYRSTDPALSARIANALAKQYIEQNLEFKFLAAKEAADFLGKRMGDERRALEQRELALQRYREQTDSVSLEDRQNIVVQRLVDLNAAVTKARTERIQKESAWKQINAIETDRAALDTLPAGPVNTFVQLLKGEVAQLQQQQAQLGERLGDRHPEMVKMRSAIATADTKLQAEIAKVVQSLRNDYESALAQERSLSAALDQQKGDALALNRQAVQYGVLQRDAASNRQIFEGLMQRNKETGISGELKTSNIRIVDAAEMPRSPATPNKVNNLRWRFFVGGLFGVGLAFFFEYLDNRIKTPEEIKAQLGLPFLGIVPALESNEMPGAPLDQ